MALIGCEYKHILEFTASRFTKCWRQFQMFQSGVVPPKPVCSRSSSSGYVFFPVCCVQCCLLFKDGVIQYPTAGFHFSTNLYIVLNEDTKMRVPTSKLQQLAIFTTALTGGGIATMYHLLQSEWTVILALQPYSALLEPAKVIWVIYNYYSMSCVLLLLN